MLVLSPAAGWWWGDGVICPVPREMRAGSSVSPKEAGAKQLTDSNVFGACHPRDSEFGFISLSF